MRYFQKIKGGLWCNNPFQLLLSGGVDQQLRFTLILS